MAVVGGGILVVSCKVVVLGCTMVVLRCLLSCILVVLADIELCNGAVCCTRSCMHMW